MSASAIEPRPPEIRIPKVPTLINNLAIFVAERLANSNAAFRVSGHVVDQITKRPSPNAAAFIAGYLIQLGAEELRTNPRKRSLSVNFWAECDKQADYSGREGTLRLMLATQSVTATIFAWRVAVIEQDGNWRVWQEYDAAFKHLVDVLANDLLHTSAWSRWRRSVDIVNLNRQKVQNREHGKAP